VAKYKPIEAIAVALTMMDVQPGYGWGSHHFQNLALSVLSNYGDAARWTLPALRQRLFTWDPQSKQYPQLITTIASIEAATTSPADTINLVAVANPQVVVTPVSTAKSITLSGTTPRGALTFSNVTTPLHGTLTGTAPNLTYTPTTGYTGTDHFTFKVSDSLTTSETGTVSIIMGTAGTGLKGEYFDNSNYTNLKFTRVDPAVNFDWGSGSPDASVSADTFSVRWSGQLLIPETGSYTFSTLNSDGVRLYIDGVPAINNYVDHTTSWIDSTPINLTEGQRVELQMDYYENTGSAVAKLKWTGPSLAGVNGSIIAKEWLYDSTGLTNRIPYAYSQSVTFAQNTTKVITLTGSGAGQTPLTYSIITPPTHGTLSGVAPDFTYTPAANYSGYDSFTYVVNNGYSNSSPANVSIGLWTASTSLFWTNNVSGNWSGAFWSNAAGGAVTPSPSGDSSYSLNFNQSGSYYTNQDLNNGYMFNQLNLGGSLTFYGTNSLSPIRNGPLLPQINQNSGSAVSIYTPLNLTAMTTFGGAGGGPIYMPTMISGPGGVSKDGPGTLQIHGVNPNTYSGGTIVNGGTLELGGYSNDGFIDSINPVGTGPITLNDGIIFFDRVSANNALIANGGTLYCPNGWGVSLSGPITLNSTLTINTPFVLNCSGAIGGAGGIYKLGTGPLVLNGNNSFTGANQITGGTLQCNTPTSLGTGLLNINTGANVYLNYSGSRIIAALSYNGSAPLAPGTYGSSSSPAAIKNNSFFSGTGTVTVLPVSSVTLALSGGNSPAYVGTPLTFTATVAGSAPTGNVAFYAGNTWLGDSALNGSFKASFTTSSLAIGSYSITAKYAGNAGNAASTSYAMAIEITSQLAATPTNLVATHGNFSVGLTWTVSARATSYNVKRSLFSGGPYTAIGTSVATSYNDLTALGGTKYYYVVSASNGYGQSLNSSSAVALPYVLSLANDILTFDSAASISATVINVYVPFGTNVTALAPTYTVSAYAAGSPASGTPRNFTTPQTYRITAEDGSVKVYTVTVTVMLVPVPPVTSGLVLSIDASKITGTASGAQLNNWADSSSAANHVANHAIRQSGSSSGYPMYVAGALNGRPVVRFNSGNAVGDGFEFTRISNIRTVFWVLKEKAGLSDRHFLLGDDSSYQFHRSANGMLWDGSYADNKIKTGTTKLMGNVIDGTTTPLPSESFQVVSLVTQGDVAASRICQDRTSHGSWQGDIAEILIYDRALSNAEEVQVGSYLASKYALSTAYPAVASPSVPMGVSATSESSSAISVSWLDVPDATSYNVSYKTSVGGTEQVVTSLSAPPTIISGLTKGISYDFKVAAVSAAGTSNYSNAVTATPGASSDRDILTFLFPNQPAATISGTTISVTVPFGTNMTTLAPTYTVSANASGSPASGTPRNFTTPQTYQITAEDSSTKLYTVAVTMMTDSVPPITSGLVLRMDASKIIDTVSGSQLNNWVDSSAVPNNVVRQGGSSSGYPKYVTGALNGQPVVSFNSGNAVGDGFEFTRIPNIRTVFWVLKEKAGLSDGHFLLGDDSSYQFHRNTANGPLWNGSYADSNIKTGTTKLMGNVIDGTTTSLPSESFQVVSLVTAGNVQANRICQDRTSHGSWQGDIAEILIYDRALSDAEEVQVGSYLSTKYALSTAYPAVPTGVSATPASPGAIKVSWPGASGASSYTVSYKTTLGGTEQLVTGLSASPCIVSGLTNGTSYDFKVAANNAAGTSAYSSVVSATPSGSSAKDILSFGITGQISSTISGTTISLILPFGTNLTALVPTYTVSANASGSHPSGTPRNFSAPQTYTITAEDHSTQVYTVTVIVAPSPFVSWLSNPAQGLTAGVNDGALADPDRDGICTLLEFVLGGAPMVSSQTILPTLSKNGGNWVFEYNRSDLSLFPATTQVVEYGSDLAGWTTVPIPTTSAGSVTIVPGSPSDHVSVTVASQGTKCFFRLKVTQ
jgi:autotransporter-associated beta strand protein